MLNEIGKDLSAETASIQRQEGASCLEIMASMIPDKNNNKYDDCPGS